MTELIIGLCVIVAGVSFILIYRDDRKTKKKILYYTAELIGRRRLDAEQGGKI